MKILDSISMAFLDIKRRKTRTILTVFALSVGTFLLLMMLGAGDTLGNKIKDMFESIGDTNIIQVNPSKYDPKDMQMTMNMTSDGENQKKNNIKMMENQDKSQKDNFKKIDNETLKNISEISGVKDVIAHLNGKISSVEIEGENTKDEEAHLVGINLDYNIYKEEEIKIGETLKDKNDVVIGAGYLKKIGVEKSEELIGKKIKLKQEFPKINGVEVKAPKIIEGKIVGIQEKEKPIVTSYTVVNEFMTYMNDDKDYFNEHGYDRVGVTGEEPSDIINITKIIREDYEYMAFNMQDMTIMLDSSLTLIKSIFSIAGIIVLIVGSFGLVNTMTMTIQERKQNIGVMKAVGAKKSSIRFIYIIESAIISVMSAILGVLLSILVAIIIKNIKGIDVPITTINISLSIIFSIVVGVIAGLLPAGRAAKLNVVDILSYE